MPKYDSDALFPIKPLTRGSVFLIALLLVFLLMMEIDDWLLHDICSSDNDDTLMLLTNFG